MPHLNADLLAVLRCPATGAGLEQDGDTLVAVGSGTGTRYDIVEGIPVLLPPAEPAQPEPAQPEPAQGRHRSDQPTDQ